MCTFDDRLKDFSRTINEKKTFVEKMQEMDTKMRNWVALDLREITKASICSILYNWGTGRSEPLQMQKEAIAEYFNTSCDVLFPKRDKC